MKRALQFCAEAMAFAQWRWRPLFQADAFVLPKYISKSSNDLIRDIQPIALVLTNSSFFIASSLVIKGLLAIVPWKVESLDGEEDSGNSRWIALLKLYGNMDYQTTTFKLKWISD